MKFWAHAKNYTRRRTKGENKIYGLPGPFPHSVRRGTIIEPKACSAPAIYPSAYPTRDDRCTGFRSRGTPVATHPQPARQAQCPGCRALPRPGEGVGRCRPRPGRGRDCAQLAMGRRSAPGWTWSEIAQYADTKEINTVHEQLFTIGARLTKPLIAGVHGAALAGGAGLVANCHIVVAGPQASFGLTEIRLGLWPFLVYRAVASAMGERRTLELSLTGRIFGSSEAREFGLVHELADDAGRTGGRNRAGGVRLQPDGVAVRNGLRPTGAGGGLGRGWRTSTGGAESGVYLGGFPGGDSSLPGEAESAVAFDSGTRDDCHSIIVDMRH